jgi:polyferredoxin
VRPHSEKTCYHNCPWGLYPLALRDSAQCGLCMECLRSCPSDNIAVNLRPFGTDLAAENKGMRQSADWMRPFLALVMLGSALAFAAVFTGPWGSSEVGGICHRLPCLAVYALGFLVLNLVILPGCLCPGSLVGSSVVSQ